MAFQTVLLPVSFPAITRFYVQEPFSLTRLYVI